MIRASSKPAARATDALVGNDERRLTQEQFREQARVDGIAQERRDQSGSSLALTEKHPTASATKVANFVVLRHHRELAFRARYPWVLELPAWAFFWAEGSYQPGGAESDVLNAIAQTLANTEAPLLDRIDRLRAEQAAIVAALSDADWPNDGESIVEPVIALLVARNELARTVATLRGIEK